MELLFSLYLVALFSSLLFTQFVTWTKNKRIYDPFEEKGVMAVENGSIVIDQVGPEHVGDYVCTPYNIHGTTGASKVMHVKIKNPPEITRRPGIFAPPL